MAGEDSTAYKADNPKDTYFSVGFAGLAKLGFKQYSTYIHLLTTNTTGMPMYCSSVSAGCAIKFLPQKYNKQVGVFLLRKVKKLLNAALK